MTLKGGGGLDDFREEIICKQHKRETTSKILHRCELIVLYVHLKNSNKL